GIEVPPSLVGDLRIEGDEITAVFATGEERRIDVLYPAMGADPRSGLLWQLGGRISAEGCIVTDEHQRTTISGIYAAGDVVNELHQIAVAAGHAAIAARISTTACAKQTAKTRRLRGVAHVFRFS